MNYTEMKKECPPNNGIPQDKERVVKQVTSGKVITKNQSPVKKLFKAFVQEDINSVKDYLIYDLVIPEVKNFILDTVRTFLFGKNGNSAAKRNSSWGQGVYTAYSNISNNNQKQKAVVASRPGYNMRDIYCETRDDGEAILDELAEQLQTFKTVSIDELYQIAGVASVSPTDLNWGWTDISNACLVRGRDGLYLLSMPEPVQIR